MLIRALEKFDDIMAVMLPTLGEERQATYSPFLPISPISGRVLYVPMKDVNPKQGTITFADEDGTDVTLDVRGGRTKLQWKPDFGMRWAALGVDFEMFGKDHQTNAPIYDRISEILGAVAPEHYVYELFLDDKGQKISKSKGNGLTIDEWLTYADPDSLSLFMYAKPREAKRLYFDVIPRDVDDYAAYISAYQRQPEWKDRLMNPAWHIHQGHPPKPEEGSVSFSLLLNLAAVANAHDKAGLWAFIKRYSPQLSPETHPRLDALTGYAVRYFHDFVKPKKQYRLPTDDEKQALAASRRCAGRACPITPRPTKSRPRSTTSAAAIPTRPPRRMAPWASARRWFNMLYQVLLGEERGPRFGSFAALFGIANTRALIAKAVKGELVQ